MVAAVVSCTEEDVGISMGPAAPDIGAVDDLVAQQGRRRMSRFLHAANCPPQIADLRIVSRGDEQCFGKRQPLHHAEGAARETVLQARTLTYTF